MNVKANITVWLMRKGVAVWGDGDHLKIVFGAS